MKELLSKSETIRTGIVVIMMLTTIMPTEIRWMRCEMWFFYCIPALFVFGFGILFWYKKMLDCTLTDVIVVAWVIYYIGRLWVGNEWPCLLEFLKAIEDKLNNAHNLIYKNFSITSYSHKCDKIYMSHNSKLCVLKKKLF